MSPIADASPRSLARMAGLFQGLEATTAGGGQVVVLGRFVVLGNATATATNILGHERLFWLGFISSLIGVIFHIVWALLLYELLKPVNRRLSLLAAFVILVGCAMQAVTTLLYLGPLLVLSAGKSMSAFTTEQLQALAYGFLRLNAHAFDIYLAFFGLWCVLIGVLIFKSIFLPRVLGILLVIAGLGWMTYIFPPLGVHLFRSYIVLGASAVGEIPLLVWLLAVGVNNERWKQQANASAL